MASLIAACEKMGVRRFIHLSAIGVDRETTSFSASKHAGEASLKASTLDWVILRPSVVIGRAAFGGSALMRGLAALSIQPVMKKTGLLQLVWLDDVVKTVIFFLRPEASSGQVLDIVGPRVWSFTGTVRLFRRWMRR